MKKSRMETDRNGQLKWKIDTNIINPIAKHVFNSALFPPFTKSVKVNPVTNVIVAKQKEIRTMSDVDSLVLSCLLQGGVDIYMYGL
jgi:hypothetical protein